MEFTARLKRCPSPPEARAEIFPQLNTYEFPPSHKKREKGGQPAGNGRGEDAGRSKVIVKCSLIRADGTNVSRDRPSGEEIVIVQVAVHAAGNLSSFGTERGTSAFEKHNYNHAAVICIRVARKPAKAGPGV